MAAALTRIIDAHHHLWDLSANYYPWLADRIGPRMYGDYAAIRRNYRVADFRRDIGSVPVVKSVHVQAEHDHADPVRETRWLQAVAENGGYPHAIVAYADLSAPPDRIEALLDAHCAFANVRGVRQMVHEVLVPDMHSPIDYLADERWQRNLALLAGRSLLFELQILAPQAAAAARVAGMHPQLQFLLVHGGQPRDRSVEGMAAWRAAIELLSGLPNVAIKLSGFGMFDRNWTVESLRPIVLWAIDRFGPDRVMFGSNFPVDGLMRDYASLWRAYDQITHPYADAERDAMFHGTAARLYRI
jgi:predicted TIM-barrel fold metal-dependent hydrolase